MNFGPINKKGGEKRLNVIFSRAKKHMAIISSIHHHHITNEYNEGANYFRRFLHYAESVSNGNMDTARTILDGLVINKKTTTRTTTGNIVLKELQQQLQRAGYFTTANVGQSDFKCSLAVKLGEADEDYGMSILIDDELHYSNKNLVEQYYQRPAILQAFGWRMIHVFAKDWLANPAKVLEQVIKRLEEKPDLVTAEPVVEEIEQEMPAPEEIVTEQPAQVAAVPGFEDIRFTRLEFTDAGSHKFWEVATQDNKLVVRFGRIGSKGQVQLKTFEDAALAEKEMQQLVEDKKRKGYVAAD